MIHGITFVLRRDIGRTEVLLEQCPKKAKVLGYGIGEWFVPGGKIEEGESQEAALCREMAEELGIKDFAFKPLPIMEGSPVAVEHTGIFLMRPYLITEWNQTLPIATLDEQVPLRWFPAHSVILHSPVPQVRAMIAMAR